MKFNFGIDTAALCVISGVVLALWVTQDICTQHHVLSGSRAQRVIIADRVVTREFNLVDDSGQTRARIGMNELNAPALSLNDKSGQERGLLRLNENDVPSLRLFDSNGTLIEGMGFAQGTMEPHLWFYNQNGNINEMIPASGLPNLNPSQFRHNYNSTIQWNAGTVNNSWVPIQRDTETVNGSAFSYPTYWNGK